MAKFSLVEFSIRHPKRVLWTALALTLLFLTQLPRVSTDTNPKHMLPETSEVRVRNDEVDRHFALYEDTLVVGIQNDAGVLNRETLGRVARITDEIVARRFWLFDPMPAVTNRETVNPGQGEWGLRAYRDVAGYDAALYLYRGFSARPRCARTASWRRRASRSSIRNSRSSARALPAARASAC